jgi:hypothetical protein
MRRQTLILGTAALIAAIVGLLLFQQLDWASASGSAKLSPTAASSYDPARYGLPGTIAGYKVFAVLTSDNTACMMPGEKRLILQATQQSVEDFLKTSNGPDINTELVQKGFPAFARWGVQVVGPGTKLDEFLSENQKWNALMQKHGCVTTGPIPTMAPTP